MPLRDHFQDITFEGNISPGASSTVEGNWVPDTDDNRDLGTAIRRWRNLYFTGTLSANNANWEWVSTTTGSEFGARINTAIGNLPSTGGTVVVDLEGAQTWTTKIIISKPCRLVLGKLTATWSGSDPGTASGAIDITSDDVTIEGSGWDSVLTQAAAANCQTMIYFGTKKRIVFRSFKLNGNEDNQTAPTADNGGTAFYTGIRNTATSSDVLIENLEITKAGARAIDIRGTDRVWVKSCYIHDTGLNIAGESGIAASSGNALSIDIGGTTTSADIWVVNNLFEQWGDSVAASKAKRVHFIGNTLKGRLFFGNTPRQDESGIDILGCTESEITDNTVIDIAGISLGGFFTTTGGVDYIPKDITVKGNVFKATSAGIAGEDSSVRFDDAASGKQLSNISVCNNVFEGVRLTMGAIDGWMVVGNTFLNTTISASGVALQIDQTNSSGVNRNFIVASNHFNTDNSTMSIGAVNVASTVTAPETGIFAYNTFGSGITNDYVFQSSVALNKILVLRGRLQEIRRSSADSTGALSEYYKSRGSLNTPTAIVTSDDIGKLRFFGYDGTNWVESGNFRFTTTGTIATNQVPSFFDLAITNSSGTSRSALRVFSDGNIGFFSDTNFYGAFDHANTANRVYTLPNSDGTVPVLGLAQTFTAAQYFDGFGTNTVAVVSSGTYNALATDVSILCDATAGNITVALPAVASNAKRWYQIKKTDSTANTVTIDPNGAETIDGAATRVLSAQWESVICISNGSNWFIFNPSRFATIYSGGEIEIDGDLNHDGSNVGFFAVTPAARQAATTDIKDALTTYGLLQGTSASPLNLDGGAVTAGSLTTTATTGSAVVSTARIKNADFITFTDADTTPTVANGNLFKASNTGATTVTAFDDGVNGQEITVIFTNANTTIQAGANMKLAAGVNFVGTADDTLTLVSDGTSWFEKSRSTNA